MDFSIIHLDADDERFWDEEVRPFYDRELDDAVLEQERAEGNGLIPSLERALAARGWTDTVGLADDNAPTLDPLRLAIVRAEEAQRVGPMLPVKGSHHYVMAVLSAFASDELRAAIFPGIARGEIICCLGYTEPDCGSDAAAIKTRAVRDGDEWLLTGQKMFSTGAHVAQYVMATARTNPDAPKHKGITVFLVPLDAPGVEVRGIGTLGGERTNFIYLDDARVPDTNRLGPVDGGWQVASGALAAEHGMDADHGAITRGDASAAQKALDGLGGGWTNELRKVHAAAVAWARDARRPDGTRMLDEPRVRARLARVALDAEIVQCTPSPYARIVASDLLIRDTEDLIDLAGSAGLLRRGEEGAAADGYLEWAYRFAQGTSIYGGTTDIQRNLIAESYMGLPRHRAVLRHDGPREAKKP